ncbi:MAG: AmmeMemoRadiSam system protein B, partial [Candidatus Aenigmarchaeota archaeon]
SGKSAAHAIASLKRFQRFIILGPSHYPVGPKFSVVINGSWETPLGNVPVDSEMAAALKNKCSILEEDESAHEKEHSIEVQLPFLQHRFKKLMFVPISIMNTGYDEGFLKACESLGQSVALAAKAGAGIIASSDFSHYVSLEDARKKEKPALEAITKLDPKGFFTALDKADSSVCGYGPIAVLLYAAKELGLKAKVLHSSNSGDVTGDTSEVVSYHAIGFYRE